nr:hypothetical protein [uncultured Acetobacterium sp.]
MQDIFGHSDAETTMNIYAEATKDLKCVKMINLAEYFDKKKIVQIGAI